MSIITFKSDEKKETGQTLSLVATATQMAIEHNFKILVIGTSYKDRTIEDCYWNFEHDKKPIINDEKMKKVGIDTGVEGLVRILVSSKTNPEIVRNYSRTVLRDRLDILESPVLELFEDYQKLVVDYPEILKIANRFYDMVFVDLSMDLPEETQQEILAMSDVIVINFTQRLKSINSVMEARAESELHKRKGVLLLIGRYDVHSKYNVKNITRYMKEKKEVLVIPYNTLYFEASSEGTVVDYFLRMKRLDSADRNAIFIKNINEVVESIITRLHELQAKL